MYALAEIDSSGFITLDEFTIVHRESLLPFPGMSTYTSLDEAKAALTPGRHPVLLLEFPKPRTGVTALWCYGDQEDLIRTRLKTWAGCYGAWRLRRLNGIAPVPLSR